MIFHLVEVLAKNPIWIGFCGLGLTIVPIIGIMFVHREKNNGM